MIRHTNKERYANLREAAFANLIAAQVMLEALDAHCANESEGETFEYPKIPEQVRTCFNAAHQALGELNSAYLYYNQPTAHVFK